MFSKKKKKEEETNHPDEKQSPGEKYEKTIEESVDIHEMPRGIKKGIPSPEEEKGKGVGFLSSKREGSSSQAWDKTKVLGAVIMICGVVVLLGGIYLGYVYLINPSEKEVAEETQPTQEEEEETAEPEEGVSEEEEEEVEEEPVVEEEEEVEEEPVIIEEEEEESTTTEEEMLEEGEEGLMAYNDSDSDGLSDLEEEILGTDPAQADSDEDGYQDGEEVLNLYNPLGTDRLINNPNISQYDNSEFEYSVLYPSQWSQREISSNGSVMFKAEDGSFVQIIPRFNEDNDSIRAWYGDRFEDEENVEVISGDSWDGIKKEEEPVFYLTDKNKENIYVIHLNSLAESRGEYSQIFQMMINSFELK